MRTRSKNKLGYGLTVGVVTLSLSLASGGCHRERSGATKTTSATMPASSQTQAARAASDADIARAAGQLLKEDRALRSAPVHVAVTNGIATVSGTLSSLLAKERAVALTGTLKGVRSVVDDVTVSPASRTDDQIKADLVAELRRDPAERAHPVEIAVKSGVVTLSGVTDSRQAQKMIEDAAKAIPGVVRVDDRVTIQYAMLRPRDDIIADAKYRLGNDVWLDGHPIAVDFANGTMRLHGTVASVAQRDRAAEDAWVGGVAMVDPSGVVVDAWTGDEQRHVIDYPLRSDADIARAIHDAFRYDPRLRVEQPAVAVDLGSVVLTGNVETEKARAAAAEDARNTVGVWRVRNDVAVAHAGPPSDIEIERAARRALADDVLLPNAARLRVSSNKGRVVLEGSADSGLERWDAAADVASLPGVAEVVNKVTVKQTPDKIKADIENRLFWDPMVERGRVTVSVAPDGVATLEGTVDSWSEIRAATNDAHVGGASRVVNRIALRNHPEVASPER